MKDKQLTIEEKIEKIQSSESFEDLKTGWFPQSASTSYYFVSYCHKDYKKVFVDILGMQQYDSEIAVWYDRELNVGRDWEKEAKTHIYDYDCLGVIFYVSENSVESPAIFKEMQMAMDAGKPFISILLPVENIRSKAGEYLYGAELLDILFPRLSEDDEKYKLYHEMFGENILYFKNTDFPQEKTERMKKSFTRQPLLELESIEGFGGEKSAAVVAVNNINVIEVNEGDYRFSDENSQLKDIVGIERCAFSNCRQLETILLPKTVRLLEEFSFYNCKKLKAVKLSEDSRLESIGDSAFLNCQNLVNITLPDSVTSIGESAFTGCKSLTSVMIPKSVMSIGECAFSDCSGLESITVDSGNTKYYSTGNCLVETATKTLILGCKNSFIPADGSVTSIGEWAFAHCSGLTSITIPDSVTSIGALAFNGCSGLTSITLPNRVKSIGDYAFFSCSSLTSIAIPDSVTSIGALAFNGCSSLTSITIPDSVTSIGALAFNGCSGLTSIMFEGTTEEWDKISKSYLGIEHEVTVTCTDGVITIGKTL